jgi:hypothetical protein
MMPDFALTFVYLLSGASRGSLYLLSLIVDLRDRPKIRKKLPDPLLPQLI